MYQEAFSGNKIIINMCSANLAIITKSMLCRMSSWPICFRKSLIIRFFLLETYVFYACFCFICICICICVPIVSLTLLLQHMFHLLHPLTLLCFQGTIEQTIICRESISTSNRKAILQSQIYF